MTTKDILNYLNARIDGDEKLTQREKPFPDTIPHMTKEWGQIKYLETSGIEYYIFPHILLAEMPAQIKHDEDSEGTLNIYKACYLNKFESHGWCIEYTNVVDFVKPTFDEAVHEMYKWLQENEGEIEITAQ